MLLRLRLRLLRLAAPLPPALLAGPALRRGSAGARCLAGARLLEVVAPQPAATGPATWMCDAEGVSWLGRTVVQQAFRSALWVLPQATHIPRSVHCNELAGSS
jgi:hypothetical protein